jgi:phosphoglycolate phosphatase
LTSPILSLGLGAMDLLMARKSVGFGLIPAINRLFPNASLHQQEILFSAVNSALTKSDTRASVINGAFDLVERAFNAGYFLAIATNKGQQSLHRILHTSGLDKYITATRCAGQVPAKPCPQMLQELMDIFDVQSEETLMIGDSVSDIEMAQALGVDSIGVDMYQLSTPELLAAGAQIVCANYSQVAAFLQL